jgi:hypothetical protein
LLAVDLRIFLSLYVVVVFSVGLPLVVCLQLHHRHCHLHEHLAMCTVLECVLSSQLLLSGEPRVLLFVLDL